MNLYPSTLGTPYPIISGTPVADQVCVFASATQVEGDIGFVYNSTNKTLQLSTATAPGSSLGTIDVYHSGANQRGVIIRDSAGRTLQLFENNANTTIDLTKPYLAAGSSNNIVMATGNAAGTMILEGYTAISLREVTTGTSFVYCTSANGVVVNNGANAAIDFRVAGDNLTHLFFVDSSQDRVFITDATTVPTAPTGGYTAGTLLAIQNNSAVGDDAVLALIAGTSGNSMIDFGDADSATAGRIDYSHAGSFTFTTESLEVCRMYGTTGLTVNENAAAACDFRVETENMPNFLFVDSSADRMYLTDGAGFHTPPTVTGGYSTGALLVVQNSSASGDDAIVSLIAATDGESIVEFGDTGDANVGWIKYNHTSNYVSIGAAAGEKAVMASSGDWHFRGNSPDAVVHVSCPSDYGKQCMTIDQNDADQVFIDYQGTSAASSANNISTWTAGNSIQGFVKVEINGTPYWMPYYDAPTS